MRYQGRLVEWNDARGFGFVEPNGGGQRAFVHHSAFARRGRRPVAGDALVYVTEKDAQGRLQARNVAFAGEARRAAGTPAAREGSRAPQALLALAALATPAALAALGRWPWTLAAWVGLASLATFAAYALDKAAARAGRWRTPEATLHLLGLAGGWPGGLLAQAWLRHKTRKPAFLVVFWLTAVASAAGLWHLARPAAEPPAGIAAHAEVAPRKAAAAPARERFQCDGRKQCFEMTSCAEARHFLAHCPGTQMDGDGDGQPCERGPC